MIKLRKAEPKDIVEGNEVILIGDFDEPHTRTIVEVLRPSDRFKAFCANDSCRYGLDRLYVEEKSGSSASSCYVAILPMSAGNDSVGTMWNETKIITSETTIEELVEWKENKSGVKGDIIITKAT